MSKEQRAKITEYDEQISIGRMRAKAPELVEALRAMCDRYPEPPGYSTIAGRQARALLAEIDDTQAEQETAVYDRYFQP